MIRHDDVYRIGRIGKPHGVGGEVSFHFDDDVFDRCDADYLVLDVDGILVPFFIADYRFGSGATALVKFDGVDTQERARELTGCAVFFPRSLSDATDDDVSVAEIAGYTLVDAADGTVVGVIRGVDNSTVNLLFEVETDAGTELLVPANADLIESFDVEQRQVKMQLPDGLLDLHKI